MESISVQEITQRCKISRKTFYYHFRDKYDLVNWIYYSEFVRVVEEEKVDGWDLVERICQVFYENKIFFISYCTDSTRLAITRWLLEATKIPPEEFADLMKTVPRGCLVKWKSILKKIGRKLEPDDYLLRRHRKRSESRWSIW